MAAFKHTHILVVVLFLLLIGFKVVLLLLNKHNLLNKVRTRTKVLDMVFGGLVLITGLYMAFAYNYISQGWLMLKLALVLASVPLAIIGLRRHSKPLSVLALLLLLYSYGIAETKSPVMRSEPLPIAEAEATKKPSPAAAPDETAHNHGSHQGTPAAADAPAAAPDAILTQLDASTRANAASLYAQLCARCHGLSGEPVLAAAPDLRKLTCPKRAITGTIYSGRGLMPSFKDVLSREEINRLAEYVEGMQEE